MSAHDSKKQTIMVVDDSEDVRDVMVMQLRESGYEVIEAGDGREAVELAKAHCPSLIFMDINMPVMDGLTATRLLREIKELCGTVIVAFSAFSSGSNRQFALEAGCNAYVSKTSNIHQLSSIAEHFLQVA
jgi:CheY-like chemotaxis protein